jgi:AI-2 transport protein TqsA
MKPSSLIIGLLTVLVVFAVATAFKVAQTVLIPLMIAWLLSYICGPVINFLVHKRVPLGLAVFFVLVLVLFTCYLGGLFLIGRAQTFVAEYPKYAEQLQMIYTDLIYNLTTRFEIEDSSSLMLNINWPQEIGRRLVIVSGTVMSFVGNLVMVLIFLVFMLMGKPYFKYKVAAAFAPERASVFTAVTDSISKQIGQYLTVKVAISGTTGVLVWLGLMLMKVEFALTWGALAFFLNFVPSIGSILASIPPILLAVVQFYPSVWMPVGVGLLLLTIQMVMGNVIEPKLIGDSLNLSPVVILISLVFFGWMWGIVGALMSVPIAAAIKIVCENIEALNPISTLMGSGKICMKEMKQG